MSDQGEPAFLGTVAILGVGLIGGSLGMALKVRRLARRVVGIGRDPERLGRAVRLGALDDWTMDLGEGAAEADMVVFCTTVGHIIARVGTVLAAVRPGAVVTDVGSTKSAIVGQAGSAPNFVGGHPMAGSEQTGVEAATATLFEDATWALTPTSATDPLALACVRRMAQQVGAATLQLTPEAHDAMVAITSHLPHVLAAALMRQAAAARTAHPEIARLAAGSFADMTRVAASSPDLWRDVCLTNRDAVLAALQHFRAEFSALEEAVAAGDPDRIQAFFAGGASAKRAWNGL